MASAFTPNLGRAQECITSDAVIRRRILMFVGSRRRLSTSKRRKGRCWVSSFEGSM